MKARALCVWYPMWSLGRPDVSSADSVLVLDERVTGATDDVLEAGVRLGMPRREAEVLAPFARVLARDPGEETRRFENVVLAVEDLVPRVEVVSPGLLFVPVAGAVRYYGGEEKLASAIDAALTSLAAGGGFEGGCPPSIDTGGEEKLAATIDAALTNLSTSFCVNKGKIGGKKLTQKHPPHHLGLAEGPFAARWAAALARPGHPNIVEDTLGFLSRLDLETLRESMGGTEMIDTFRWLGISTLGEVTNLPRETLASRFGNQGILAHRLASGEDRALDPREIPQELTVSMEFEDPLEATDAVLFAGRNIVERLLTRLRSSGVAPHSVEIAATPLSGKPRVRVWRSAEPLTERAIYDRVRWQLSAWVETAGVVGGVTALRVSPHDLSGEGRQMGLLNDESTAVETERALVRAQALLGPDSVLQSAPQGGRMPSEKVAWSRWGEEPATPERDSQAPWPGATPSPAPALVHPELRPIDIEWDQGLPSRIRLATRWEPVLTWSGPWRLSGRWWAGEQDADRFQIVTSAGAFLCVVAQGRAYLAGVYD